jgi:hypothetical protein
MRSTCERPDPPRRVGLRLARSRLELLILSGRSPEHAMCMLVPPAYRNDEEISDELRAFYQYIRSFSEPWDGPAGLVFTDGTKICASLDRNGLRPSRYKTTADGILYIGSEAGAVVFDDANVTRKGRLGPGQMLSANTTTGEFKYDREIKEELARQKPYRRWIDETASNCGNSSPLRPRPGNRFSSRSISPAAGRHGISQEELDMVFPPMIKGAQEAVFSMGDDIPLAILSTHPRLLYTYFKQLFAQVTNPPIDPIREWAVMSLGAGLGPERNLLEETPSTASRSARQRDPLRARAERIKHSGEHGFPAHVLDCTWPAAPEPRPQDRARRALRRGSRTRWESKITSSSFSAIAPPPPSACPSRPCSPPAPSTTISTASASACAPRSCGNRRSPRRPPDRLLFRFGATAICPYLGYATVRQLVAAGAGKLGEGMTPQKGDDELPQGARKRPAEDHVQNGHLRAQFLPGRADLRGHRHRPRGRRFLLHRRALEDRRHRLHRNRRGVDHPPPRGI